MSPWVAQPAFPVAHAVPEPVRTGQVSVVQVGPGIASRQLRDVITDVRQHVAQCSRILTVDIDALVDGDRGTVPGVSLPFADDPLSMDWLALAARQSDAALVLISDTSVVAKRLQCCATTALWIDPAAAEFARDDVAVVVYCDVRCRPGDAWQPFATWLLA